MIRNIPSKETRRWTGIYPGSFHGTLWKTSNIDLDRNEGFVGLSQRCDKIEDSTELPDLGGADSGSDSAVISVFLRTDADCTDRFWGANRTALFKTDSNAEPSPSNDWDTDALDSSPSSAINDMVVHGNDSRNDSGRNKLFVTTDSDIYVLNDTGNNAWTGAWWVTKQSQRGLDTSVPHPIQFFPFRKISILGDGNLVHTISRLSDTQNDTVTYKRLSLPKDLVVNYIFTTSDRAWLCCYNKRGSSGAVVEWDGFSETYNKIHDVYGVAALSGVDYNGSPILINSKGMFLEFSGNGFYPMIRNGQSMSFPVAESVGHSLTKSVTSSGNSNFKIHGRGMVVGEDGLIYILAGEPSDSSNALVYEYKQGGGVWCLNPLSGRIYLKHTLQNVTTGADFGQTFPYNVKALYYVSNDINSQNSSLLAGATLGSGSATFVGGIWYLASVTDATEARGYFITQYIPVDGVREFWDLLWLKFQQHPDFQSSRIVVKARGTRPLVKFNGLPLQGDITWTSTTSFTVTLQNTSDDALSVGDEVEIVRGANAGRLVHITTISGAHAALQTITVDEAVNSGSGTSIAVFERWKKLGSIDANSDKQQGKLNIGIDSSFMQFKVELRGRAINMSFADMLIISKPSTNLE